MKQLFSPMSSEERKTLIDQLDTRLVDLQNNLIGKQDIKILNRLYLIQRPRCHIPGVESFDQQDGIYDELTSTIWTHAKN